MKTQTPTNKPSSNTNLTPRQRLLLEHRQELIPGIATLLQMYGKGGAVGDLRPHCIITDLFLRFGKTEEEHCGSFKAYAIACARNLIIDECRRQKNKLAAADYEEIFHPGPRMVADWQVDEICLSTVLSEIEGDHRQGRLRTRLYRHARILVEIAAREDRMPTQQEMAARLGIHQSNLSRLLRECMDYLRGVIERCNFPQVVANAFPAR